MGPIQGYHGESARSRPSAEHDATALPADVPPTLLVTTGRNTDPIVEAGNGQGPAPSDELDGH